jgi:hypothetical protein
MITYVAVPYQVFELTHSSFAVGMLGAAQLIPLLLFALWGGAYADAMDRRKLLIVSEIVMAGGSLALAVNGMLVHASVPLIFIVGAIMSACSGFHRPALDAMTPRLVDREDLTAVSALNFFRFSISSIGGPALGGVCMADAGISSDLHDRRCQLPHFAGRAGCNSTNAAERQRHASGSAEHCRRAQVCIEPAGTHRHIHRGHCCDDVRDADGAFPFNGRGMGRSKSGGLAVLRDVVRKPFHNRLQRLDFERSPGTARPL